MWYFSLKLAILIDFAKKNSIFAPLQLNWMQVLFSIICPAIYDSNKFTSFTDCSRQGKVIPDIIIHTNKPTYKILTEDMLLSNSTKIFSLFFLLVEIFVNLLDGIRELLFSFERSRGERLNRTFQLISRSKSKISKNRFQ